MKKLSQIHPISVTQNVVYCFHLWKKEEYGDYGTGTSAADAFVACIFCLDGSDILVFGPDGYRVFCFQ